MMEHCEEHLHNLLTGFDEQPSSQFICHTNTLL